MQSLKKLDIGCGRRGKKGFDGLDVLDIPGIKYPRADARHLPIENNTYDEIFSQWVLEHFKRTELVDLLTEWKRVLKPGGKIVVVTNNQRAINQGLINNELAWTEWEYLTLGGDLDNLGGCHKVLLEESDVELLFHSVEFSEINIRSTTKVRGEKGELKCPGIIISAIK